MRRRPAALLVALWSAAGAGALAIGSAGVGMVGNRVTGSHPPPLSAGEVRSELAAEVAPTTEQPVAPAPTAVVPEVPLTTSGRSPSTSTSSGAVGPGSGITAATLPAETRTYKLIGGTATLRFTPSGVTVQDATPNPGFSVEVEPEHGNGVEVEFRSDAHRSRVSGWWSGGPQDEVREDD